MPGTPAQAWRGLRGSESRQLLGKQQNAPQIAWNAAAPYRQPRAQRGRSAGMGFAVPL